MESTITLKQACAISGMKKTAILHHVHRGRIAFVRVHNPELSGKARLALDCASFEAFLTAYRAGAFPVGFKKASK